MSLISDELKERIEKDLKNKWLSKFKLNEIEIIIHYVNTTKIYKVFIPTLNTKKNVATSSSNTLNKIYEYIEEMINDY